MYKAMYKCRLCSKTFLSSSAISQDAVEVVIGNAAQRAAGIQFINAVENQPDIVSAHHCAKGSYGIADFLGMRYEAEK